MRTSHMATSTMDERDPWAFRWWILHLQDVVSAMDYWPDNWWVDRERFRQYVYQGA